MKYRKPRVLTRNWIGTGHHRNGDGSLRLESLFEDESWNCFMVIIPVQQFLEMKDKLHASR